MHAVQNRQPPALICAAFLATLTLAFPETPPSPKAAEELQAANAEAVVLSLQTAAPEEWEKLERTYADLAARYPLDPAVRSSYGNFLWERNAPMRALHEWEEAERLDPKNATVLFRLADAHLAGGRAKSSAQYFQKAVEAEPANARYRHAAGNAIFLFRHELVDAQTNEERWLQIALSHFAEAARLAPLNVDYARAYAETFYGLPKPDWRAAVSAWEHYLQISPNQDFAHANLARVFLKLGQRDTSKEHLDQIHGADFERLKDNLRRQIELAPKLNAQ
jgi:tetratricopeptide (TPR) repeat protein